jgi:hypothetical protein
VEILSFAELSPLHQHPRTALIKPVSGQHVPSATVKWFDLKALGKTGEPLIIQPK